MTKNWQDGLKTGAYHNPGTRKHKKRGRPKGIAPRRIGIHKIRMARRRDAKREAGA